MNQRIIQSALIGATMLLSGMGSASAAYIGQCAVELNSVEAAIRNPVTSVFTRAMDQSNLLVKLSAAEAKVTLFKYSDAVDKLQDISDTSTALAAAAKPKLQDAAAINEAVKVAIACVGGLH